MRIIAGQLKGRTLHVPRDATFRPTTDRVKESVFNVLGGYVAWEQETICDIYAGSGGLGLEALSRGAQHVTFVERSRASLAALDHNIASLDVAGKVRVLRMPVEKFFRQQATSFSLIFADPPYADSMLPELATYLAPMMTQTGIAVVEHAGERTLESTAQLDIFDRRDYGTTSVTFFRSRDGGSI